MQCARGALRAAHACFPRMHPPGRIFGAMALYLMLLYPNPGAVCGSCLGAGWPSRALNGIGAEADGRCSVFSISIGARGAGSGVIVYGAAMVGADVASVHKSVERGAGRPKGMGITLESPSGSAPPSAGKPVPVGGPPMALPEGEGCDRGNSRAVAGDVKQLGEAVTGGWKCGWGWRWGMGMPLGESQGRIGGQGGTPFP